MTDTRTALDPTAPVAAGSPPQAARAAEPAAGRSSFALPSARRLCATAAELAFLGVVGFLPVVLMLVLLGLAAATILVFGLGLLWLIALIHLMVVLARLETARVQDFYGLPRTPVRLEAWSGSYPRWLWRQGTSSAVWRPMMSFITGWVAGVVLLAGVQYGGWLAGRAVTHLMAGELRQVLLDLARGLLVVAVGLLVTWGHSRLAPALVSLPSRRELTQAVQASRAQRASAVRSADLERTRIERDLHDGVQPRLVSIGMTLGLAQHRIDSDPDGARALIAEAHASTKSALTELRQVARGIHASVLADRGLDAALSSLAARSPVPVELDMRLGQADPAGGAPEAAGQAPGADGDCGVGPRYREAETAAYYLIAEALTNAAKHARATVCRVQGRVRDAGTEQASLWIRIEDDGVGGARVVPGGGLDGISQRVAGAGGTCTLTSPDGGPTALEVSLPCA